MKVTIDLDDSFLTDILRYYASDKPKITRGEDSDIYTVAELQGIVVNEFIQIALSRTDYWSDGRTSHEKKNIETWVTRVLKGINRKKSER